MTRPALVLAALAASCAHLPHVDPAPRDDVAQAAASMTVVAECRAPFGDDWSMPPPGRAGSAVVIDERHAITAYHVEHCPFGGSLTGYLSNGRRVMLQVDREDEGADLARAEIATADNFGLGVPPPRVGRARLGDAACAAARGGRRSCGRVLEFTPIPSGDLAGSWPARAGDSGAGVYAGGELVGIAVRMGAGGGFATTLAGRHDDWFAP